MHLEGSCHCGAVTFSLDTETPYPYMRCYCSICRKTGGGGGFAVNIMGDAAIGMTGLDIETAVRNRIGILTIVFNNGVMAIETDSMPHAIEAYAAHSQGGNYSEIAKSLGAWSIRVETPDAFLSALKDAIAATEQGQPALIECITKEGYDFSKYP